MIETDTPESVGQILAGFTVEEILDHLQKRVADGDNLSEDLVQGFKDLQVSTEAALTQRQTAQEKEIPKDWLDRIKQEALVVRRHRVGVGGRDGYGNDPDIFPTQKGKKYETLLLSGRDYIPHPSPKLMRKNTLEAISKRSKDLYPALVVNDSKLDGDDITIFDLEARDWDDIRRGNINFIFYVPTDFGHELAQALKAGDVNPNIIFSLYNHYYPSDQRKAHQTITTGEEQTLHLMEATYDNEAKSFKDHIIIPLSLKRD